MKDSFNIKKNDVSLSSYEECVSALGAKSKF